MLVARFSLFFVGNKNNLKCDYSKYVLRLTLVVTCLAYVARLLKP